MSISGTEDGAGAGNLREVYMLAIQDYQVSYDQSEVIRKMSFNVAASEIVVILGRNGMGKTTLMRTMMGMGGREAGSIRLGERSLSGLKSFQRVKEGLAFVPQGRMIFSTMSVRENLETGLTVTGKRKIPEELFELFPVLKEMQSRRGGNLSGGQQQQLAIARALASNPKVLLLDEPTEGIQPSIIKQIAATLRSIREKRGLTIIASEQVLSFAMDIADRILVIEKGEIVVDEKAANLDRSRVAAFLSV